VQINDCTLTRPVTLAACGLYNNVVGVTSKMLDLAIVIIYAIALSCAIWHIFPDRLQLF